MCFCAVSVWLLTLKKQPLYVEMLRDWPSRPELQWDVGYHRCSRSYLGESETTSPPSSKTSVFSVFCVSLNRAHKHYNSCQNCQDCYVCSVPAEQPNASNWQMWVRQAVIQWISGGDRVGVLTRTIRACNVLHLQIIFTAAYSHVVTKA